MLSIRRGLTSQVPLGFAAVPAAASYRRWLTITPLKMPALSPTMVKGGMGEWIIKVGDKVKEGTVFCKVETDKAAVAFENSSEDGYFARIIVPAGTKDVELGATIGLLIDEKDKINDPAVLNWVDAAAPAAAAPKAAAPAPEAQAAKASVASGEGRPFASPLAKKTAQELNVSLNGIAGTGGGANNRITKEDVLRAAADPNKKSTAAPATTAAAAPKAPATSTATSAAPVSPAFVDQPLSTMRSIIASRLTSSKSEIPHYYESMDLVVDDMTKLLKHLNAKGAGKYKITVNDFLVKAIARANLLCPACNTHWVTLPDGTTVLRQYSVVDCSVAVATPTGLITPIIKDAHAKGLVQISNETKELAKRAKEGGLLPQEYQGGTVTISNLGGMGMQSFTAIINPPQSTIVAVGGIRPRPEIVKDAEGEWKATGKIESIMNITASFDHRVVDGAMGAEWFKHLKDTVENPLSLLL